MPPTLLYFVILVSLIDTVASAALRSPLNQYFTRDKKGLNIFDYNARGIVPDKITDLGKPLSSDPSNVADPKMGTTREALFRAKEKKKKEMEEWLGGRKVVNDCPTFPFCNHIPAPPPVMPGPENLEQINPHIVLPWSKARDPLYALMAHKPDKYNKWDHIKNKKWGTQDPNFHQPYTKESPSQDPNYKRVHEDVMRHIYSPALGHIGAPGGIDGSNTLAKSVGEMDKASLDKVFTDPKLVRYGAGMRIDSPNSAPGYQPPGKPNRAWEARESKDTTGSLNVDVPPPTKPNETTDTKEKAKDER